MIFHLKSRQNDLEIETPIHCAFAWRDEGILHTLTYLFATKISESIQLKYLSPKQGKLCLHRFAIATPHMARG